MMQMAGSSTKDERFYWLTLMLVLSVAVGARVYHLDSLSLSADELANAALCGSGGWLQLIESVIAVSPQPPFYPLLLCNTASLFGDADFVLRLPSAMLGVLQVFLVYRLGRDFLSVEAGLLSAAWIAVAFQPIFFSQNAEYHLLQVCLQLGVLWFFLSLVLGVKSRPSAVSMHALTLWCGVAMLFYTGYSSLVFLLALLGCWYWSRRSLSLLALPWLPYFWRSLLLVFLLWLPVMLRYREWFFDMVLAPQRLMDVQEILRLLLGPSAGRFHVFLWLAVFSVVGYVIGLRRKEFSTCACRALPYLLAFVFSGVLLMFFSRHIELPNFLLHQSLLVLLVSAGLTGLLSFFGVFGIRAPLISVAVLLVICLNIGENVDGRIYVHKRKPDFREAVQVVQEEGAVAKRAAPVFVSHDFIGHYLDKHGIGGRAASTPLFAQLLTGQTMLGEFLLIEYSRDHTDPAASSDAIHALQERYQLRCLTRLRWIAVASFVSGESADRDLRAVPACASVADDDAV